MSVYSLGDKSPKFPNEGDYWIAPGAHVLGQVELGKNVGIWFGSVLRGDNDLIKIGDETVSLWIAFVNKCKHIKLNWIKVSDTVTQ